MSFQHPNLCQNNIENNNYAKLISKNNYAKTILTNFFIKLNKNLFHFMPRKKQKFDVEKSMPKSIPKIYAKKYSKNPCQKYLKNIIKTIFSYLTQKIMPKNMPKINFKNSIQKINAKTWDKNLFHETYSKNCRKSDFYVKGLFQRTLGILNPEIIMVFGISGWQLKTFLRHLKDTFSLFLIIILTSFKLGILFN